MEKRGVSTVLMVIVLVLLVVVAIGIVWSLISIEIRKEGEVADAKNKLLTEKFKIDDITVFPSTGKISAILSRGKSKIYLENLTVIEKSADIVFILDSTASMEKEINDTKTMIDEFSSQLVKEEINFNLALIEFRDYNESLCGCNPNSPGCSPSLPPDFPNKTHTFSDGIFTTKINEYKEKLASISMGDGGDWPESHLTAIESAFYLKYRDKAKKVIILLTDAQPHAKDCLLNSSAPNIYEKNTTFNINGCYKGPTHIENVKKELVNNKFTFYYINKESNAPENGLCIDDMLAINATSETGGKFYNYTEVGGVKNIIIDLASQIITEYSAEKSASYLLLVFYNDSDSETIKIENPPSLPFETKKFEFEVKLNNVKKAELYAIIVTPSGREVVGPLVDSWEFK